MKIVIIIALVFLGMTLYVRFAPLNTDDYHKPLAEIQPANKPNFYMRRGDEAVSVTLPVGDIDAIIRSQARTKLLAGDLTQGLATYVQRSRLFGFPDYITIAAQSTASGARLEIVSRSRFGYSDLGVNKARVENWLAQINAQ